jgi:hypothetical protein
LIVTFSKAKSCGFVVGIGLFLALSGCGGIYKPGSVQKYDAKAGQILTNAGGAFRIGRLPANWQQQKIDWRAVLFRDSQTQATITVSSWCKSAFSDSELTSLDRELYHGLSNVHIVDTKYLKLSQFNAKRTTASGTFDGRGVFLRTYVLKLNECVFDFAYVAEPGHTGAAGDFDTMVKGFQYLKGPNLL